MCVCVCVRERERERRTKRQTGIQKELPEVCLTVGGWLVICDCPKPVPGNELGALSVRQCNDLQRSTTSSFWCGWTGIPISEFKLGSVREIMWWRRESVSVCVFEFCVHSGALGSCNRSLYCLRFSCKLPLSWEGGVGAYLGVTMRCINSWNWHINLISNLDVQIVSCTSYGNEVVNTYCVRGCLLIHGMTSWCSVFWVSVWSLLLCVTDIFFCICCGCCCHF